METEIGVNESVSTAVIRAVSAVKGRKPASFQPLNAVIDTDTLDSLFDPRSKDRNQPDGCHSFSYGGCQITIESSELLSIEPLETTDRPSAQSDGIDRAEESRSNRDTEQTTTERTPRSRVCMVCQRPIDREDLQRERGEIVHDKCHAEARCGISLER